jgi:hypothetical protein
MQELQTGSWYRLIGGEQVRVVRVDVESGIANVSDPGGQLRTLARSAFVGAQRDDAVDVSHLVGSATGIDSRQGPDGEHGEASPGPFDATGEPEQDDPVIEVSDASLNETQENTMQEAQEGRNAAETEDAGASAGDSTPRGEREAATPPGNLAAAMEKPSDAAPGDTREFDFDDPDNEAMHTSGHGLSPLALGMLLGMLLLAGIAGWLVLQSRLDNLETQFAQLDERLQVVMGDTRRQGETLRTYLADPRAASVPTTPPTNQTAGTGGGEAVTALERQLAVQSERVAALEKRLANQDAALAELDRRAGVLEKRPVSVATTPKAPTPRVAKREAGATPIDPPAGYIVVLASLPVREQALQELDRLRDKGLSVVLREARIKNAIWYRVQAEGFRDRESATVFARTAESRHGIAGAWVVAP